VRDLGSILIQLLAHPIHGLDGRLCLYVHVGAFVCVCASVCVCVHHHSACMDDFGVDQWREQMYQMYRISFFSLSESLSTEKL
jgi:hypothetical protein